jgi:hypothetical protein
MAAKDIFHAAVRQALIKEQWVITADPLIIKINKVNPFGEFKIQNYQFKIKDNQWGLETRH